MTKWNPASSVRRPESGTWQSVAMETAAMGGRTGTHGHTVDLQQHEPADGLGDWHPMKKWNPPADVRRPESGTWQSVAMETAAMGGRTGTHETLWTWQQH
ncbi:unnamed protein product, partial [Staurois parvus]